MRQTIEGYAEAKDNFGTRRLTLGGIVRKSRLSSVLPLSEIDEQRESDLFVRTFAAGFISGYPSGLKEYYSGAGAEGDGAELNINFYPTGNLINGKPSYVDQDYQGVFCIWFSLAYWCWNLTDTADAGNDDAGGYFYKDGDAFEGSYGAYDPYGSQAGWGTLTIKKWGDLGDIKPLRPCLLSLGGIAAKRKLTSIFVIQPILSNISGTENSQDKFLYNTDCFLSTGGIGKCLTTSDPVICQEIMKVRFGEVTRWDTFGDSLGF